MKGFEAQRGVQKGKGRKRRIAEEREEPALTHGKNRLRGLVRRIHKELGAKGKGWSYIPGSEKD